MKKRGSSFQNYRKKNFCFIFWISKNLFYKSFFTIQYTLKNKIKAIILANICAIRSGFINKKFAKIICQILEINSNN